MSDSLDSLVQGAKERARKRAITELIHIAEETAKKRALSDPWLVAAYLTGSLRSEDPFLGNTTDIDIVFIHAEELNIQREILPLTPEVHLDIVHKTRSDYEKPKELRTHPWLGPEIYDPLPLYVTQHFFEFIQAGVRDKFNESANVLARSRQLTESARQTWRQLRLSQNTGPEWLLRYLNSICDAANAVALLTGNPLAERRFLLQFPERAGAAGQPGLAAGLLGLLGANRVDSAALAGFLPGWEKDFLAAASSPNVQKRIAVPRLGYYKQAFVALLSGETPLSALWPMLYTWTASASVLPPAQIAPWQTACETLGLAGESFTQRLEGLDRFLDSIEEILDKMASDQGL
ncbi:MAG: hypothetical protein ABIF04_00360 [Chloroflexota bacterium]